MSLYHDAAPLLASVPGQNGSLKSRVFNSKTIKSPPKQVYALVSEASKWSPILVEVIEKAQLIQLERKIAPNFALLLVHDLLLTRRGISAPASYPLRLAVERHKARLSAEFARVRLKRRFGSVEDLRAHIEAGNVSAGHCSHGDLESNDTTIDWATTQQPHPRWVRVNTLKTSLDEQLRTTFAGYDAVDKLEHFLALCSTRSKALHVDKHIPNLVALPPATDLSKTHAYTDGLLILQDKASCFPAYLLDPEAGDGDCLDACAAPGNKTTHLAAILQESGPGLTRPTVFACERDKSRALTLTKMVYTAGAERHVVIKANQDFLRLDPDRAPWNAIGWLLLDPSCSGSGIIGREDERTVLLPSKQANPPVSRLRKRKRKATVDPMPAVRKVQEEIPINEEKPPDQLAARLTALSTFQLKLLLHAFQFPEARRITYSTCSVYAQENEHVVMKALDSTIAKQRGWCIMQRGEQVSGMKAWEIRGNKKACGEVATIQDEECVAEACIRCEKGTKEGMQGFFVAAFVRGDPAMAEKQGDDEWEGFSDTNSNPPEGVSPVDL